MYVIKDTKCWEKTKNQKKKILKPPPSLHSHPIPQTFLPLPSWSGPPSALSPGSGRKPGGRVALGTREVPTSSPSAGLGGVSGLFMYLLHTHQPMQVPTPAPPCFCAFAHSPQAPRASPVPLPAAPGSGMDRGHLVWNQQGVPLTGPSPPPSQVLSSLLPIRVSGLCLALGGGEGTPPTQREARAAPLPPPDSRVCRTQAAPL